MILLDPPISASRFDPFSGSEADGRYMALGGASGTTTLAGGVATLALLAGDPGVVRNQSLAWPAKAMGLSAALVIAAHDLDAPHIGSDRRAAGLLVWADADNADFVGVVNDGDGLAIGVDSVRDGVMTPGPRVAYSEGVVNVRAERDGAEVLLYAAVGDDAEQLLATISDFPELPAGAAVFLQTDQSACEADFDDFRVEIAARIDMVSDVVMGCHLRQALTLRGRGFPGDVVAAVGGPTFGEDEPEICEIRSVSETEIVLVTPLRSSPGPRWLWLARVIDDEASLLFPSGLPLRWSDDGYRILRGLLPPGRYTVDPANPFNTLLASLGCRLDRLDAAARDLCGVEIFPEAASQVLHRWESIFGIPIAADDDIADRRARVTARNRLAPRMTTDHLNSLIGPFLPDVAFTAVSGWDVYGDLVFRGFVYEPWTDSLSHNSWGELEQLLNAAGPGWGDFQVGADGFTLGASAVGRDFL